MGLVSDHHSKVSCNIFLFFSKLIIYLFIFRERGKEGEGQGEKHSCARETWMDCLSHDPNWGHGLKSRRVL